jgi:hypothetical protein
MPLRYYGGYAASRVFKRFSRRYGAIREPGSNSPLSHRMKLFAMSM